MFLPNWASECPFSSVRLPKEAYLRIVDKKNVSQEELYFAKADAKAMGIDCFLNSIYDSNPLDLRMC